MSKLSHAKIHFNDQGTPVAAEFDDVYFSNDGGLAETDYVFLQQNGLPKRWQEHSRAAFHIVETGFGTGANFLLSWLRFRQFKAAYPAANCQRLYFSSFEKFPLTLADLTQALAVHTELSSLCQQLLSQYPPGVAGCHRLSFDDGTVVLDLWFGDVNESLPQLNALADAVFLDGFAPSKNPQMWQDNLFIELARLSHSDTTVSTFTSAGIVKRGLKMAGFSVNKVKGFGRKREMLNARYDGGNNITANNPAEVTLVGGGIASLCCALALIQRGVKVSLLCEDSDVAMQASQNRQGAVYPNLHASLTADSQLHSQAFLYARRFYQHWQFKGLDFAAQWCGLIHLATNPQLSQRQDKMLSRDLWPTELVTAVNADTASELAGVSLKHQGIYFPAAGWLSPKAFCKQALNYLQQKSNFNVQFNCRVEQLQATETGWLLDTSNGIVKTTQLVLAAGSNIAKLIPQFNLPLNRIRGQVSHIACESLSPLKTVLCHKGYITPQWQGEHSVGATFDRTATEAFISNNDDTENLALVNEQLDKPDWFNTAKVTGNAAAFRATLPDHLPMAGAIAPNLYLIGGLGARGIMLSPLLAELLSAQICAEPLPLAAELIKRISPARFVAN